MTKNKVDKPFSISNCKAMYNNTLILERFIGASATNQTCKKSKNFQEPLDYGKIAA